MILSPLVSIVQNADIDLCVRSRAALSLMAVLGRGREFLLQKSQGSEEGFQGVMMKYINLLEGLLQEDTVLRQVRAEHVRY